jgi:ATP-dependent RNA helicase DOB1
LSFHFYQSQTKRNKDQAISLLKNKIDLLKELGYITQNREFSWKGELACRMYSYELQTGEIFQEGLLQSLDTKQLAILISALVYEPRKGQTRPPLSPKIKKLSKQLNKITRNIYRTEKKHNIFPQSKRFYFHLSKITSLWFDGIKFHKLGNFTDIDEGEIVRYFRMNIQILRELKSFEGFKPDFKQKINQILTRINRDMVDAEKQLRQEI